ncbi:UvrB/UvrC motif-containing protein [Planctomicrobium sp. SH668]|uniref:UvrB/UvrC motif-containing protein n=1 Tax=Planctomicrobium sp. SH668 TaxID=3448126 RepID=UPI003F5C3784
MRCTKQATLHITEIKSGKSISLHLCETCAQEYLSTVEVGGIPEEYSATYSPAPSKDPVLEDDQPEVGAKTCPSCGITFKQFRSQGRLGCPRDYEVFHSEIVPLLESIHGETQHVGKFPPEVSENSRRQHELIRLRNELKSAVDEELYEQAAKVRDQIQVIEAELKAN